jgi:hypothetical protein
MFTALVLWGSLVLLVFSVVGWLEFDIILNNLVLPWHFLGWFILLHADFIITDKINFFLLAACNYCCCLPFAHFC